MHRNSFLCKSFLQCFYSLFFLRLVTRDWSPLSPHPTCFVFHPPYIWLSMFICSSLLIPFSFYLSLLLVPTFFLFLYFRLFSFLFFLFLFPFLSLKYPSLALQLSLLVILSLPSFPAQTNLSSVTLSISITLFLSVSQLYLSLLFSLCNL